MSPDEARPDFSPEAEVERLRTIEVSGRMNKVSADALGVELGTGRSFKDVIDGLPSILEADSYRVGS